ncbi:hypothetical protein FOL47_000417 [Perkinsus chesapeaki]|uniref:39S ribosomal protein L46, mitochondrial n=1 Tax=Perkinsus chesapeaki TaxID=330153 RepID=A0A7J6MLQ4_PERCH|nr:hypothetical protein FOL47_000417 [Perkinsus chesapeaki]
MSAQTTWWAIFFQQEESIRFAIEAGEEGSSLVLRCCRRYRFPFYLFMLLRTSSGSSAMRRFSVAAAAATSTRRSTEELQKYAGMPAVAVHKGYKLVMSLSICRLPPIYTEPLFIREHRAWRAEWEDRTNNELEIADSLVYQNFPHHFLPSRRELALLREGSQTDILQQEGGTVVKMSELEKLMAEEGLTGLEGQLGAGKKKKKKQEEMKGLDQDRALKEEAVIDAQHAASGDGDAVVAGEVQRIERLDVPLLGSLARSECPGGNNDSLTYSTYAAQSLKRICGTQLGEGYAPHFVGTCPMHFRKFKSGAVEEQGDEAVVGTKVFYYRAIHLPSGPAITLSPDGPVEDFAWVSRGEMSDYVGEAAWYHYRRCLPLDLLPGQESVAVGEAKEES